MPLSSFIFDRVAQKPPPGKNMFSKISLLKKRPWHRCLPVNFVKFIGTLILKNICELTGADPEILKRGGALCRPPWLADEDNFRFQMV